MEIVQFIYILLACDCKMHSNVQNTTLFYSYLKTCCYRFTCALLDKFISITNITHKGYVAYIGNDVPTVHVIIFTFQLYNICIF